MSAQQISVDSNVITPTVNQICLTFDRIGELLRRVYESACKSSGFKLYNLYPIFFSIAGTLLITCLTSKVNDFTKIWSVLTQDRLMFVAWGFFVVSLLSGLILLCVKVTAKQVDMLEERDSVVDFELGKLRNGE